MKSHTLGIVDRLASGPARGLGQANTIAVEALGSQEVLRDLMAALRDTRSVVTARAANALKKVQSVNPEVLLPHVRSLLLAASECQDLTTRWNLILIVGSLPVSGRDKALAVELMFEALGSGSGFLRAFALTGLANFARDDKRLFKRVLPIWERALADSSAAVRARARKLQKLFRSSL